MKTGLFALLASLTLGVGAAAAGSSLSAEADQPAPVGAHRHYVETSAGKVYVGPDFCEVDASAQGFAAFHRKVHVTDPGIVDVISEPCD